MILLRHMSYPNWFVEDRSLTVSDAASVKVWDYLVSLVLIRVWDWCDRSVCVCVCHSGNLSVLAPSHGKHQARGLLGKQGPGHTLQPGPGSGVIICMETSPPPPPTCSGVCNLATERLTLLLSYYHYIDFMYVDGGIFVLFVYFNCYMFYFLLIFGWKRMFLCCLSYCVKYDVSAEVWSAQWAAPSPRHGQWQVYSFIGLLCL